MTSTNFTNQELLADACVANQVLQRMALRWKMSVLHAVARGVVSFAALKRAFPAVSDQVLAKRLRELVEEGALRRDGEAARAPVYAVTPRGAALLEVVRALCAWAVAEA